MILNLNCYWYININILRIKLFFIEVMNVIILYINEYLTLYFNIRYGINNIDDNNKNYLFCIKKELYLS